jgi:4-oxalocrotonate tautomerase
MPLLRLTIASAEFSMAQSEQLHAGLTGLMADVLHKQADLTVVAIDHVKPTRWARAGVALPGTGWSASLEVFITAGTNTAAERADFIAAAHQLISACGARPADTPVYIVVNEVNADSWGYDGMTQLARRSASVVASAVASAAHMSHQENV